MGIFSIFSRSSSGHHCKHNKGNSYYKRRKSHSKFGSIIGSLLSFRSRSYSHSHSHHHHKKHYSSWS